MNPKDRLSDLRGKAYYDEFAVIWAEIRHSVMDAIDTCKHAGRFTIGDLIRIADAHELPFKPTVIALEREKIIPAGTWDKLEMNGFSLKKCRQQLAEQGLLK